MDQLLIRVVGFIDILGFKGLVEQGRISEIHAALSKCEKKMKEEHSRAGTVTFQCFPIAFVYLPQMIAMEFLT